MPFPPRMHRHHAHAITIMMVPILLLLLPTELTSYSFVPSLHNTIPSHLKPLSTTCSKPNINNNNNNNKSTLTMKVSKNKSKTSSIKGSSISVLNAQRKKTAGRRGTKNFVDPTKLFIGNIPFQAQESDLRNWFESNLGTTHNIESLKIIKDWKTGNSKGYGFVNFMDPICATSAMELLKGRRMMGRMLKLSQGQKKEEDSVLFVKKREKKKEVVDQESVVIGAALDEAESDGLSSAASSLEEYDDMDDALLFFDDDDEDYDDDDEEFEYDGIFEEMYKVEYEPLSEEDANKPMNREQKREALKRRKKKKLPHKGFR